MSTKSGWFLNILPQLFQILPILLITVGCVLYLIKTKSVDAILMLCGNVFWLLASFISVACVAAMSAGVLGTHVFGKISIGLTIFYFISVMIFGIGFLMMAIGVNKAKPGRVDMKENREPAKSE
ncbi:MAG: hypothetical protein K9N48_07765 [Verrucomicrobia bacterium]|nr:hypothetical protein [Verrucomicrobiota bacterium]MCF7708034.1 hypothetical protein [Verrucomicrobiota bacterium]